jgi:hypothetical protein
MALNALFSMVTDEAPSNTADKNDAETTTHFLNLPHINVLSN